MKILNEIDSFERTNKNNIKVGNFICRNSRVYIICEIFEKLYSYKFICSINVVTGDLKPNNSEPKPKPYYAEYDLDNFSYKIIPEKYNAFINKILIFG